MIIYLAFLLGLLAGLAIGFSATILLYMNVELIIYDLQEKIHILEEEQK